MDKEPVVIVDYNPQWPTQFEQEKALLEQTVGDKFIVIEHIGSTSVLGLGAKPIIDIMAAVKQLVDAEFCVKLLGKIGYTYVPEFNVYIPERRFFYKGKPRSHNLHVVEPKSEFWKRHLVFRDALRSHPEIRESYYHLKVKLAQQYRFDRDAYTDAKTEFIRAVEAKDLIF